MDHFVSENTKTTGVLQHNKPKPFYDTNISQNPIYLPLHLCNETQHFCNIHTVVIVSSFSLFAGAERTSCIKWAIFTMGAIHLIKPSY